MVYTPAGSSDLLLIVSCMTTNFLYFSFSTLQAKKHLLDLSIRSIKQWVASPKDCVYKRILFWLLSDSNALSNNIPKILYKATPPPPLRGPIYGGRHLLSHPPLPPYLPVTLQMKVGDTGSIGKDYDLPSVWHIVIIQRVVSSLHLTTKFVSDLKLNEGHTETTLQRFSSILLLLQQTNL